MNIDTGKIEAIYNYVRAGTGPLKRADGLFVFGRADPLVANRTAQLLGEGLADYAIIAGGIGKDSGPLTRLQIPEAHYLASLLVADGVQGDKLYVESRPRNGGECCEMGLGKIVEERLPHEDMTVVIHPTSLKRIMAMLEHKAPQLGFKTRWQGTGTHYTFDSRRLIDQKEAVAELLRLADWPVNKDAAGNPDPWCAPQADLPWGLVDVARAYSAAWKAERK